LDRVVQNESLRNDLAYGLSFAEDDSDFTRNLPLLFTDSRMREQLEISRNQLRHNHDGSASRRPRSGADDAPLPRTVQDALRPSRRAVVITETAAPFRIVDVNGAWEQLCGYTFVESKGKTLGSLLKGPETNQLTATSLISKLLQGEEAGATLTNYAKDGRMFRNRLRAGPLYDDSDFSTPKYFVGVLQEVQVAYA
jgi:PAS domain S-box-containing protein